MRFHRAGVLLTRVGRIFGRSFERVEDVDPPAADDATIERWLKQRDRGTRLTLRSGSALQDGNLKEFRALERRAQRLEIRISGVIGDYGFRSCA